VITREQALLALRTQAPVYDAEGAEHTVQYVFYFTPHVSLEDHYGVRTKHDLFSVRPSSELLELDTRKSD